MRELKYVYLIPFGAPPKSRNNCVLRAVSVAACVPYAEVKAAIDARARRERPRQGVKRSSANSGVFTNRAWFKEYMRSLGFEWTATMSVGSGCRVHLCRDELPAGRLVCMVSRHAVAVVDGVLFDNHDSRRGGTRCVYGYWRFTGVDKR